MLLDPMQSTWTRSPKAPLALTAPHTSHLPRHGFVFLLLVDVEGRGGVERVHRPVQVHVVDELVEVGVPVVGVLAPIRSVVSPCVRTSVPVCHVSGVQAEKKNEQ